VNILKKVESVPDEVNEALFAEPAEKALFEAIGIFNDKARHEVQTNGELEPEDNLALLAELREPVDRFFDDVMVMAEDEAVRANRLALLTRLRGLFLKLADISRL